MKMRSLLCVLSLALAVSSGLYAQPPGGGNHDEPETELGKHMEKIGGAFRALRRQITDAAKNEDSLKRVAVIKENAQAALKLEPAFKAKQPESEQAKFVAAYQERMKNFLADVDKIEAALKAGDNATAEKLVSTLNDDQKEGHTKFRPPQKKKRG